MKNIFLCISFFFILSCQDREEILYKFKAKVIEKGNCGHFMISLKNNSSSSDIEEGFYHANNLTDDLKVKGVEIVLNCRIPTIDELSACNTQGIVYPSLIVIEAEKDTDSDCYPELKSHQLGLEKDILVEFNDEFERNNYTVIDGDKILFSYNLTGSQCDHISDDEWGEKLLFIVDKNQTSFEYLDEDIISTKCFYQQFGAWVNHNKLPIKKGSILGQKLSNSDWEITLDIKTSPLFENGVIKAISFTEVFKK